MIPNWRKYGKKWKVYKNSIINANGKRGKVKWQK